MDQDQAAPIGSVLSGYILFVEEASKIFQQTTKACDIFVICALRANKCEFSVYTVTIFTKCTHICAAQTTY